MKRYLTAYGLWLAGVLSAAAVAYLFYRRLVLELEPELGGDSARRQNGSAGAEGAAAAAAGAPELELRFADEG